MHPKPASHLHLKKILKLANFRNYKALEAKVSKQCPHRMLVCNTAKALPYMAYDFKTYPPPVNIFKTNYFEHTSDVLIIKKSNNR